MKVIANPLWDKLGQVAAIAIAFAIPTSTAATSYCMGLVLGCWFLGGINAEKRNLLWHHPLSRWIAPLVVVTLLGSFYSVGDSESIRRAAIDGIRLAFIPFFMYYFQTKRATNLALWAFCAAMILTLVLGFLKVYAGLPIGMKYTVGAVFKSHIKTSFFMAMAAFFLAYQIRQLPRYRWLWIALIALMIYYLLFMSIGRIGYITLSACLLLLAWQWYRWKGIVGALLIACALFGGAYHTSTVFVDRINLLAQDLEFYKQGGRLMESSLGSRLHFAFSSVELMDDHPWIGSGTGSFGEVYAKLYENEKTLFTDNPHNEYLRVGVELGVMGVICLLLLFYQQWRLSFQISPPLRGFCQGFLITFFIGCFLNSWLKDFTEGYFYCVMTAICYASLPLRVRQSVPTVAATVH